MSLIILKSVLLFMFGTSQNPKNSSCATRNLSTQRMQNDNCSLFDMSVYSSHIVKVVLDVTCYITGYLIHNRLNYFILNIVTRNFFFFFAFISSSPLIAECLSREVLEFA